MATKAFKEQKIAHIKENVGKAKVAIVTNYKGLSVEEITLLRRELQKAGADYTVTKNTLAKIALKGTNFEVLTDSMKESTAVAFGFDDEVSAAKVVQKFIKEKKKAEVLCGAVDGQLLTAAQVTELANTPSKEELYAKMLGCVNSPATGIVGSVNAVMSSLVRAIDAVAKQKTA
jgi:large subunit ribosomal protein L10